METVCHDVAEKATEIGKNVPIKVSPAKSPNPAKGILKRTDSKTESHKTAKFDEQNILETYGDVAEITDQPPRC